MLQQVFFLPLCLGFISLFTVIKANADELSPRSYTSIPINLNFGVASYIYTDGDLYLSPDVPYEDVTLKVDGVVLGYARTFSLFGNLAKFDTAIGRVCADAEGLLEGDRVYRSFCGNLDTKVRFSYNFYGPPALTIKEFATRPKELVVGASIQFSMPTGDYDTDYILNAGANRWFIKPEVGFSFPWHDWAVDISLGAKFFTDNTDLKKTSRFEQDPIYNLQFHLVYNLRPVRWLAINSNYFDGGDTYVDGVKSGIKKSNSRAGITYSMAINKFHTIKIFANTGVTTRLGNDSNAYGLAWSYLWF